jgi:S-adenosylmethionine:tRNA ribosyltransferase-isomerase
LQLAFEQKSGVVWKCLVGNSRRWKSGKLRKNLINKGQNCILQAERVEQASGYSMIRFVWDPPDISLSEILMLAGITPLPPYVTREANETDAERYQTIYARSEGSVAAPTAGLHFTDEVLQKLISKNISMKEVVLHVGAGTFKPVSNENIREHEMHAETIIVRKTTIQKIIEKLNDPIITVGTTSIRTIESLYWHGVKLLVEKKPPNNIDVKQWDPYDPVYNCELSVVESLQAILNYMEARSLEMISGQTQLMIVPGYRFRISSILITNFHMPRSTLLLLVSAFIGQDWVKAYNYALHHDFRFLSYGDACLFYKQ